MKPRQSTFYDPTIDAETATMFGIPFSQQRSNAALPQGRTMSCGSVCPVSQQPLRPASRMTWLAGNRGNCIDRGQQLRDIVPVGGAQRARQRDASAIGDHMVLASQFAPIRGIWAGFFASLQRTQRGAVHDGARPIDLIRLAKFFEQHLMEALPHARPVPGTKITPAGNARAAAHFAWQIAPGNAGFQYEENAGEGSARMQRLPARKAAASRSGGRQQWRDPLPHDVLYNVSGHGSCSLAIPHQPRM